MDILKFINSEELLLLSEAQIVNGIKQKLWIERYRDICNFEIIADIDQMVHKVLTRGSLISHTKTSELMIVENHEIREDNGVATEIKITGRSFESVLEERVVGSIKPWPTVASATEEYILPAAYTWDQGTKLIQDHIYLDNVIDPYDAIPHVDVVAYVSGAGVSEERPIKRGGVYTRLIEILNVDNLGIKTARPNYNSPLGPSNPNIGLFIHSGINRTNTVSFSHITGEIESADYLWSDKKIKNAALVTGRWIETMINNDSTGFNRRMMLVDASDIDNSYTVAPTGVDRDNIIAAMRVRGNAALASQKSVALIKIEASKNASIHKYRTDYNLGDIITANGHYSETAPMRVTEYVEIEDETGESGYPTLSAI